MLQQSATDSRRPKSTVTTSWYIRKAQKNLEEKSRACDVDSPFIDSFSNMLNDARGPLSPYSGTVFENYVSTNHPSMFPGRQQTPVPPTDLQVSGDKILLDNSKADWLIDWLIVLRHIDSISANSGIFIVL